MGVLCLFIYLFIYFEVLFIGLWEGNSRVVFVLPFPFGAAVGLAACTAVSAHAPNMRSLVSVWL